MNSLRGVLVAGLLRGLGVWSSAAKTNWQRISEFRYDWDQHGAPTFIFEAPSDFPEGGKLFTMVRIQVPDRKSSF